MNPIHEKLIKLLLNNSGPVTSRHLSQMMGISVRSVKTYISQINQEVGNNVIISGNQGYSINGKRVSGLLKNVDDIPQTFDERRGFIIREFLLKHSSSLEIEDICNRLCVSESTLRADITKINKLYESYKISFRFSGDLLLIEGPERSLRKMYSLTLLDNVESSYFDYDLLQDEFSDFNIRFIPAILRRVFTKYNYFINEFALFNLTLHVAVIVDRLKKENYVQQEGGIEMSKEEKMIVADICEQLEEKYDVRFNNAEKDEIYILFRSNANLPTTDEYEKLKEMVGNDISDEALQLIE